MAEKQREQKQVDEIGGEVGKLKLELEALVSTVSMIASSCINVVTMTCRCNVCG